jgi:hypothetical protein
MKTVAKVLTGVAVAGALFLAWGFMLSASPEGKERARQRAVIERCERETDVPALSDRAKVIAYHACEKLKADYRAQWGREP